MVDRVILDEDQEPKELGLVFLLAPSCSSCRRTAKARLVYSEGQLGNGYSATKHERVVNPGM
jgi:hypothetical protein